MEMLRLISILTLLYMALGLFSINAVCKAKHEKPNNHSSYNGIITAFCGRMNGGSQLIHDNFCVFLLPALPTDVFYSLCSITCTCSRDTLSISSSYQVHII